MGFDDVVALIKSGKSTKNVSFDFEVNQIFDTRVPIESLDYDSDSGAYKSGKITLKDERHHDFQISKCSILHVAIAARNEDALDDIIARGADLEAECDFKEGVSGGTKKRITKDGNSFWADADRGGTKPLTSSHSPMTANVLALKMGLSKTILAK